MSPPPGPPEVTWAPEPVTVDVRGAAPPPRAHTAWFGVAWVVMVTVMMATLWRTWSIHEGTVVNGTYIDGGDVARIAVPVAIGAIAVLGAAISRGRRARAACTGVAGLAYAVMIVTALNLGVYDF